VEVALEAAVVATTEENKPVAGLFRVWLLSTHSSIRNSFLNSTTVQKTNLLKIMYTLIGRLIN
jgi:hypothetical protein